MASCVLRHLCVGGRGMFCINNIVSLSCSDKNRSVELIASHVLMETISELYKFHVKQVYKDAQWLE